MNLSRFLHGIGELAGVYMVDAKAFNQKVRLRIHQRCEGISRVYSRQQYKKRLEIAACEAIAEIFQETYTGKVFKVSAHWPRATVVIDDHDGIALIEPWIGIDADDDGLDVIKIAIPAPPGSVFAGIFGKGKAQKQADTLKAARAEPPPKQPPVAPKPVAKPPAPAPQKPAQPVAKAPAGYAPKPAPKPALDAVKARAASAPATTPRKK